MKKLTKDHLKRRTELALALDDAYRALTEAAEKYNEALATAREFIEDVVSEMSDYQSERSEKWTESDAGSAYENWTDE